MSESNGALAGFKIVDLTRVLAGPSCTQVLGDHGADIVKVEPPTGDETRVWGPPFQEGEAAYFIGVNRNKRSIAIDLSRAEGHEVLFRLLEDADLLIENFKSGTMEKWGLGYEEALKERYPRLIYCRIHGLRHRRAARRHSRLRRRRPSALGHDEHQRHGGDRADPCRHAHGRSGRRIDRTLRDHDGGL